MNNPLREDIQNSLHGTIKALSVISQNQENINPNTTNFELPYQSNVYNHAIPNGYSLPEETESEMHAANNVSNNKESFTYLLPEMQDMKNTIKT